MSFLIKSFMATDAEGNKILNVFSVFSTDIRPLKVSLHSVWDFIKSAKRTRNSVTFLLLNPLMKITIFIFGRNRFIKRILDVDFKMTFFGTEFPWKKLTQAWKIFKNFFAGLADHLISLNPLSFTGTDERAELSSTFYLGSSRRNLKFFLALSAFTSDFMVVKDVKTVPRTELTSSLGNLVSSCLKRFLTDFAQNFNIHSQNLALITI